MIHFTAQRRNTDHSSLKSMPVIFLTTPAGQNSNTRMMCWIFVVWGQAFS